MIIGTMVPIMAAAAGGAGWLQLPGPEQPGYCREEQPWHGWEEQPGHCQEGQPGPGRPPGPLLAVPAFGSPEGPAVVVAVGVSSIGKNLALCQPFLAVDKVSF